MKVLLSWLREFTPLEGSGDELDDVFGMLGTPVEERHDIALPGIVVARVLATRPHPEADRIQLVDVDAGDGEALQICCGAFNMAVGDLVPLATLGTTMPNGMEIARRKMRGEWSNGMLCSPTEIGLGADAGGIMILPADLAVGDALTTQLGLDGEVLFDLEVNPNRPDAMSIAGVARDLAARFGLPFAIAEPQAVSSGRAVAESASAHIDAADLCGRFGVGVLRGVAGAVSPLQIQTRLSLCGMRPISAVVDVSNYVMLELGIPNHAYDLATVPSGELRTRRARAGERVTTLDEVDRELADGDGVITDAADRVIGLAGVMGGLDTEISDTTTDVLLEAAWWHPASITRTSRRLKLFSEASSRFARGTDPELIPTAIARFAELLAPSGVTLDDGLVDTVGGLDRPPAVTVRTARVNHILGTDLDMAQVVDVLAPIGFEPTSPAAPDAVAVEIQIPSWRPDSATEIDVIEEVGRMWGYDRIARTVPRSPDPGGLTPVQQDRHLVRDTLVGLGLDEAMPMPFLAPDDNARAGLVDQPVSLSNPLDAKESVLRTSLLPGLLGAIAYNESHRNEGVALFEIGHVYRRAPDTPPDAELPDEREMVAVAVAGADAAEAKLLLDELMGTLAVAGYRLEAADDLPGLHPTRGARVYAGDRAVGVVGEVDPMVAEAFDVAERVGWFALELGALLQLPHGERPYRLVSRYPSSDIDLAFVVDDTTPADAVEATLAAAAGDQLASLRLFDVYRGDQVDARRRSLAFALRLQSPDATLTDAEVGIIRQRCIDAVTSTHPADLR